MGRSSTTTLDACVATLPFRDEACWRGRRSIEEALEGRLDFSLIQAVPLRDLDSGARRGDYAQVQMGKVRIAIEVEGLQEVDGC